MDVAHHLGALFVSERAGLEKDLLRDGDLAQVVQRGGAAQVGDEGAGQAQHLGEAGGEGAHALGVLVGVVVVVLRHRGEDGEALQARLLELDGADPDGIIELVGAALGGALKMAREQVRAHPEQQLDLIDGLGEEVAGAGRQAVIDRVGVPLRGSRVLMMSW